MAMKKGAMYTHNEISKFVAAGHFESAITKDSHSPSSMFPVLVLLSLFGLVFTCPPQPNGNCYAGSYISGQHSIVNQRCSPDPFQDWCAVTYQPTAGVANFGCANNFQPPLGLPKCGLGIEKQGCNTVETANGPCLLCCCKGGSCNHPQVFMQQAQLQFGQTFSPDPAHPYPPYYGLSTPLSLFLSVFVVFFINIDIYGRVINQVQLTPTLPIPTDRLHFAQWKRCAVCQKRCFLTRTTFPNFGHYHYGIKRSGCLPPASAAVSFVPSTGSSYPT